MRLRPVIGNLGTILKIFSIAFVVPIIPAFAYEVSDFALGPWMVPTNAAMFAALFLGSLGAGFFFELVCGKREFRDYEGYAIVGLTWFLLAGVSALPFYFSSTITDPASAFFEAMSGITTTGFSVLASPESLPRSILFWRAFIQFIGGGGIIVLMVAVLSKLTSGALRLMRAEVSGGSVTRLKPKIAATAKILWGVYLALNIVLALAIFAVLKFRHGFASGEAFFQSLLYAFPTISTGGFAPTALSAGVFGDWVFELVITIGMIAGGTSFSLLYIALQGRPRQLFRDPEFRAYILVFAGFTILIAAILVTQAHNHWDLYTNAWTATSIQDPEYDVADTVTALRYASFQTATFLTDAGFNSVDYDLWPDAAKVLLILLTFIGGMYGSTAGGPKAFRILILSKTVWREIMKIVHPRAQFAVRIRGNIVSEDILRSVSAFFFAYLVIFIITTIVISLYGYDFITSVATAATTLANVGTSMGAAGPSNSFATFDPVLKIFLSVIMWFGRLEIFAALILLFPRAYSR